MNPQERFDEIGDIYERLGGEARRHVVDQRLRDIKTQEDLQQAREFVNNIIAQGIITAHQLAKRTNYLPSAISAFRNDKWKGKQGTLFTMASRLTTTIDQFLKEQEAEETAVDGFATTRFVEEVQALVEYAKKRRKIGAFGAPAGSGKSTVLREVCEATPGAVLIVARKCRSAVKPFLQLWARSLGLTEEGRAEDIQDRIITCLSRSGRIQLIDEAHKLQVGTLDVIREVWDETHVPIILAGTPSLHATLTTRRVGAQTSELMDQLYSRIGVYRDLSSLTNPETGDPERLYNAEDIRKVFARGHVRLVRDGIDFLCQIANSIGGGGLRACKDLVQFVVDAWPGDQITAALLNEALKMKIGPRDAAFRADVAGAVVPAAKVAAG